MALVGKEPCHGSVIVEESRQSQPRRSLSSHSEWKVLTRGPLLSQKEHRFRWKGPQGLRKSILLLRGGSLDFWPDSGQERSSRSVI